MQQQKIANWERKKSDSHCRKNLRKGKIKQDDSATYAQRDEDTQLLELILLNDEEKSETMLVSDISIPHVKGCEDKWRPIESSNKYV